VTTMRTRMATTLCIAVLLMGAAACSSDDDDSAKNTTTTANRGFEVQTPDGQVSLSLSGQLPPNWPDDFPVPDGAEPAGSGSLGGSSSTSLVGVYSSSGSPQDTYNFYKDNTELTVTSSSSVGSGSAYLGTVQFTGDFGGWVVTLPYDNGSLIVAYLSQSVTDATVAATSGTAGT
jgi:hypothetical protein